MITFYKSSSKECKIANKIHRVATIWYLFITKNCNLFSMNVTVVMPFPKQINASLFTLMIKMQGIYWIIDEWETSFRWTINEWPWWIRSLNQTSNVNDKISELDPTDIPNSSNSIYYCILRRSWICYTFDCLNSIWTNCKLAIF